MSSGDFSPKQNGPRSGTTTGLFIGFHKNISFLSLEIESVLEYSVDPDEKSFVQYFLWVFTDCHSPRLLQIDLNKILTIWFRNNMRV